MKEVRSEYMQKREKTKRIKTYWSMTN